MTGVAIRALALVGLVWTLPACSGERTQAKAADQNMLGGDAPVPGRAEAASECGAKGQADCPLQGWMKANLQSQLRAKDFARLEVALGKLAAAPSPAYEGWTELAKQGALAAASQDMSGLRKSCKTCHDRHREAFRSEMRSATGVVPQ